MKHDWILVANAARASLYAREAPGEPLRLLQSLEHGQSRLRAGDLSSNQPGHENADQHRGGGVSFEQHTEPRRKEHQRFAQQLAQRLSEGVYAGQCGGVTIFASAPFLGELRALLDERTQHVLRASVDSDLTACSTRELEQRLAAMDRD
jgi:protein required for attachment to host cells